MKTITDALLYGVANGMIKYPDPNRPTRSAEAIKKQLKRYKVKK